VLANDHLKPNSQIAAVQYDGDDGTFSVAADGRSLVFTPDTDYFGYVTAKYLVDVPGRGRREAVVSVYVSGVTDAPRPVDDQFDVLPGQMDIALDVLKNDVDPDDRPGYMIGPIGVAPVLVRTFVMNAVSDAEVHSNAVQPGGNILLGHTNHVVFFPGIKLRDSLRIVAIGATSRGGSAAISTDGDKILYTPAAGYIGEETFTYTVRSHEGLTAEANVTIVVGPAPNEVGQNDARLRAIDARRIRRAEPDQPAGANPAVVQGLRVSPQVARRLSRESVAAAHDAALRAPTGNRKVARVRAVPPEDAVAANVQAAPGPVIVLARRTAE
jgi:hypothetical protein